MAPLDILVNFVGLVFGSLLAAALLTFLSSWIGDRLSNPWLAPIVMLATIGGMYASPLWDSLFVRILTIFAALGAVSLCLVALDADTKPEMEKKDMEEIAAKRGK